MHFRKVSKLMIAVTCLGFFGVGYSIFNLGTTLQPFNVDIMTGNLDNKNNYLKLNEQLMNSNPIKIKFVESGIITGNSTIASSRSEFSYYFVLNSQSLSELKFKTSLFLSQNRDILSINEFIEANLILKYGEEYTSYGPTFKGNVFETDISFQNIESNLNYDVVFTYIFEIIDMEKYLDFFEVLSNDSINLTLEISDLL